MISAGLLDQKVTPLYPTYTGRSDMGAQQVTWRELTYRWARVQHIKGAKVLEAGESLMDQEIAVTMYYTPVVTERCRLRWNGHVYEILSLNGTKREGTLTIRARRLDEGSDVETEVEPTTPATGNNTDVPIYDTEVNTDGATENDESGE